MTGTEYKLGKGLGSGKTESQESESAAKRDGSCAGVVVSNNTEKTAGEEQGRKSSKSRREQAGSESLERRPGETRMAEDE